MTVSFLSVDVSRTHYLQLMSGWAWMSLPSCVTCAHILAWHRLLWLSSPPCGKAGSILGINVQYQTRERENGWSQVFLRVLYFLSAAGLHGKMEISRLFSTNFCDEFRPSVLVACQKFLWDYTRHEERQRNSHSWTLASPAGRVVCVKPLEPVQRQGGGGSHWQHDLLSSSHTGQ